MSQVLAVAVLSTAWLGVGLWTGASEDHRLDLATMEWRRLKGWQWTLFALAGPLPWLLTAACHVGPILAILWALDTLFF